MKKLQAGLFLTAELAEKISLRISDVIEYSPTRTNISLTKYGLANLKHFYAPVIHPTTGKIISKYNELANDHERIKMDKKFLQ